MTMKNIAKLVTLPTLTLTLLLGQAACAETPDVVKDIYDALLAEDSDYSEEKALYAEYFPEMEYEETLEDDSFTITVSGNEYMDGSWTFVQDGNYLTVTMDSEDYTGMMFVLDVLKAVGDYYGMNTDVLNGYITGLNLLDIENEYFIMTEDDAAGTNSISINIAGPYDMKELDQMVLDERSLEYEPLNEDYISRASSIGKLLMVANGTADDVTILIGEYGGLDDLAYQSIMNVVNILQPKGWEEFAAKLPTTTSSGGLILALIRALTLLA